MSAPASARYARVVVDAAPAHLDRTFDYLVPEGIAAAVGHQVRVTFAGRRRRGWVAGLSDEPQTAEVNIRPLGALDGSTAWFDVDDLRLYRWVADRYAGSLADVLRHALPARVARVEAEAVAWPPPVPPAASWRSPCPGGAWQPYGAAAMLCAAGGAGGGSFFWRPLPGDDAPAMAADLAARALRAGRSALVLVADPSSVLADAVLADAGPAAVDLRGVHGQAERYRAWLRARTGHTRVVVGERSAVFAPLAELGLILVDDEANPAYKERRSPRHHAREVALARARMRGAACVLVGDLPSAACWRLRAAGLLTVVEAGRGAQRARLPRVQVVNRADGQASTHRGRFSDRAAAALQATVAGGGTAVVLAARRGEGAVLACRNCGRRLACPVCTGSLGPAADGHGGRVGWVCGGCRWSGPTQPCPVCGDERTAPLAAGAGRLAQELSRSHPQAQVLRMEGFDAPGPDRRPAIAVMTRGSVVTRPAWLCGRPADVVVIIDADAMLRRGALDAGEDALRLWLTVARWTRQVIVQTREPGHPAIQALVRRDPDGFWEREAQRRAELRYPPAGWLVRLTGPAVDGDRLVSELRSRLPAADEVLGPTTDGAALVKSATLRGTLAALTSLRHEWGYADRRIRIDVDPATTQ